MERGAIIDDDKRNIAVQLDRETIRKADTEEELEEAEEETSESSSCSGRRGLAAASVGDGMS